MFHKKQIHEVEADSDVCRSMIEICVSVVSVVTKIQARWSWFYSQQWQEIFVFSKPPNILFNGDWGINQPSHKTEHSPSSNAEIKNEQSYTSVSPLCLHWHIMGWPLPYLSYSKQYEHSVIFI
jgi:hypothetical protein